MLYEKTLNSGFGCIADGKICDCLPIHKEARLIFTKVNTLDCTKYINILAVMYAFVIPLSRAGISLLTALLIILWLCEGRLREKVLFVWKNNVIKVLSMFILFNIFSLFWSEYVYESLVYISKYWYLFPLIVFFTSLEKRYLPKVLSAFIFGMFVSEVISYGVFFELWTFKHASVENPSPFMHHIEYSVFLALTGLILLGRIFNSDNMKHQILYIFFFITVSGNLFLTAGRTGQFAFILGLFVLVFSSFRSKLKALFISSLLSGVLLFSAYHMSVTFSERIEIGKDNILNVIKNKDYCTSWGGRVGSWVVSKDIIGDNPLLGVGLIDNMKVFHSIINHKYPEMRCMHQSFMHTHNQFLEVMTQIGIVGIFIFISMFYFILKIPIVNSEYRKLKNIYSVIILFAFLAEVIFHRQFSMALFALVIGLLLSQYRIENEI